MNFIASPPRSRRRTEGGLEPEGDVASSFEVEPDPSEKEVTRGFLRKALDAQAETMATVFQEEFIALKSATDAAAEAAQSAKIMAQEAKVASIGVQDSMQKMRQAHEELAAQLATAQGRIGDLESRASGSLSASGQSQDQELARSGRIGSLGWDSPADVLKERALECPAEGWDCGLELHRPSCGDGQRQQGVSSRTAVCEC